jgi:uncharacterized PurR-regulated membrane protein YhhQ (DUF165 family)
MSRSLFIFSIFYGGMVCIAGVLGAKQVALGPLAVEAGIFPFLLLVIMSSAVSELHGKERADQLVRFGFIPLIASIFLIQLVLALPVYVFARLARPDGRLLWLRAGIASVLSQVLDTILFISISFYGEREIADLMVGQMTTKIVLSVLLVPLLVTALVKFGRNLDRAGQSA